MGPILLLELSTDRIRFWRTIREGITAGVVSLLIAVGVDSWFWQQLMWAEGAVFWFNAVEGKSVAWGVSPWHTYFTSLLPKISGVAFAGRGFCRSVLLLGTQRVAIYRLCCPHYELGRCPDSFLVVSDRYYFSYYFFFLHHSTDSCLFILDNLQAEAQDTRVPFVGIAHRRSCGRELCF